MVEGKSLFDRYAAFCGAALVLAGLAAAIHYDYLLFHSLAEIFFVVVAFSIFVLAWNSRRVLDNNYLLFLGISYLFVGGMHVAHVLAYKGIGVFPGLDPYLSIQIWVAVRFVSAVAFLIAPLFFGRKLRIDLVFLAWTAVTGLLLGALFGGVFPTCFVEGRGLTPFKQISELVISALFLASLIPLYGKRDRFDPRVFRLIVGAVIVSLVSEIPFAVYHSVFDLLNVVGHLLLILSTYFMYQAIIVTGLQRPRDLLFRELNQHERTLQRERAFVSAVLDTAGAVVIVLDREGRIISFNRACEDVSGYKFDEVKGKCFWDVLLLPEDVGPVKGTFERLRAGQFPNEHENHWISRDGARRLIHWSNSCLTDPSGEVEYVIATGIDITERQQAEDALLRTRDEWERTFDSVPDLIAIIDTEYRIQRVNKAMADRLGRSPDQCLGSVCYEGVHCTGTFPPHCPHALTIVDGRQHIAEVHEDRLGGDFLVSTTPLFDSQGKMTGSVHVARDITDRKRAEEELRATRDYLENLFDYANAPIIVWDPEFRITRFNRAFERLTGRTSAEVLGRRLDILFPGDRRDEAMAHIQRALSGERWEVVEIPIIRVDGTVRTVLWNSATLFAPDGAAAVATIAQGQDITDRKRSELLLRKANAEIEQFLYTASHDLKSPLVTIQGFLGYMVNDTKAGRWDRMAAYTERVQAAAGRMARLIDDLLKFSHIGRIAYEPADINLTELVRKVVSAHGQELAAAGISVVIREDLPPLVGDMDCIQQVFDHLLANAIKYGSSAAEPRIEIGAARHGGEIRAFVKDNGKGIPPEYHEKIFKLFHRLGHDKQGVGVGLAIVKRIVEVHGGRVWIESAEGQGATFWLAFPAHE